MVPELSPQLDAGKTRQRDAAASPSAGHRRLRLSVGLAAVAHISARLHCGERGAGPPEQAVAEATEILHEDSAYEFELPWKLWYPESDGLLDPIWKEEVRIVRVVGLGPQFDDGSYEQNGHIRVDLGLDTPFICDDIPLHEDDQLFVKKNIQQLVDFTTQVEKNCGVETRLLWTESEESLAQKLIARLQKLN